MPDFHELLDIMARLPDILEQTEVYLRGSDLTSANLDILTQSWLLDSHLQKWYHQISKNSIEPHHSSEIHRQFYNH
jgi:hypothetical protein